MKFKFCLGDKVKVSPDVMPDYFPNRDGVISERGIVGPCGYNDGTYDYCVDFGDGHECWYHESKLTKRPRLA